MAPSSTLRCRQGLCSWGLNLSCPPLPATIAAEPVRACGCRRGRSDPERQAAHLQLWRNDCRRCSPASTVGSGYGQGASQQTRMHPFPSPSTASVPPSHSPRCLCSPRSPRRPNLQRRRRLCTSSLDYFVYATSPPDLALQICLTPSHLIIRHFATMPSLAPRLPHSSKRLLRLLDCWCTISLHSDTEFCTSSGIH